MASCDGSTGGVGSCDGSTWGVASWEHMGELGLGIGPSFDGPHYCGLLRKTDSIPYYELNEGEFVT